MKKTLIVIVVILIGFGAYYFLTNKPEAPEASSIKVFFAPNSDTDCQTVVWIEKTIPKTKAVARAAINELLKGPTAEEREQGFLTAIPEGSKLNSLRIENGIAYADFNKATESGGGSCSMALRVAQITQTLLQFPTVKSAVLSIEGRTGDIFQP